MKLFCDMSEGISYVIEEGTAGEPKNFKIEGVFMQGDIKNRNGRSYPVSVLEKETGRYVQEYVDKKRAFGELGHPNGPTINMDRISHLITKLTRHGSNFVGEAKILDTPMGNIVKGLMKEGVTLGVSSRGIGTLKQENGMQIVQDDFHLATAADIVADPSAPEAFVKGVMENADWVQIEDSSWVKRSLEDIRKEIHEASKDELNEELYLKKFKYFMHKIAKS